MKKLHCVDSESDLFHENIDEAPMCDIISLQRRYIIPEAYVIINCQATTNKQLRLIHTSDLINTSVDIMNGWNCLYDVNVDN